MSGQPTWRKSSHSDAHGQCVELAARKSGGVLMRDSTDPDGPVLAVPAAVFGTLLADLRRR